MGLDLDNVLAGLTPEQQEDILDQLDIATAEEYKRKGYGLQVSKPSKPDTDTDTGLNDAARIGLYVVGFIANLFLFLIGLLLLTVSPILGVPVLAVSGVPLAAVWLHLRDVRLTRN